MSEKQKILIVDDKKENLFTLEQVLKKTNTKVIKASNGNEALIATLNHDFAMAILDVQMPEMDGYELAEFIRNEKKTRGLPIIFVSAVYSDEYHVFKGYNAGAVDFMVKPFDSGILLSKIKVFLTLDLQKKELRASQKCIQSQLDQLTLSETRFKSLVLTIPDIVYRIDPDGNFTFVNDAIEKLGYQPEELIGEHFSKIILPEDLEDVSRATVIPKYKKSKSMVKNGPKLFDERRTGKRKTTGLEIRLIPKNRNQPAPETFEIIGQKTIVVEINSAGLYFEKATKKTKVFVGTVGVIRDISDRKLLEDNLRQANDQLETKVKVRTVSLQKKNEDLLVQIKKRKLAEKKMKQLLKKLKSSQAQLIQAEKLSAMGTLTAGIAHELNNPMMGMMNFIQYCIKHTPSEDKKMSVLEDTKREIERCIDIVKNLLIFSHMEDPNKDTFEKVQIATILNRVFKLLSYRIEKERIVITTTIDEKIPAICVKQGNIQQVFLNLVSNALDALKTSKKKNLDISIRLDKKFANIEIRDTGSGIDPENLNRIFDPFFTTKPPGQGTGMGLSVSHGIVVAHKGEIKADSQLDKGTRFTIRLPINQSEKKSKILIVDDDENIVLVLKGMLQKDKNYQIETASNGTEALIKLGNYLPDLLIIDLAMPGMDGIEVCKAIQKEENMSDMIIIIITGYPNNKALEDCDRYGVNKVYIKPLTMPDLKKDIKKLLTHSVKFGNKN